MSRFLLLLSVVFFVRPQFTYADTVALLSRPTEAAAARLEAITNAKSEIYFSSYILRNDSTSLMLLAALRQASLRGVRVRIVIDAHGNKCEQKVLAALAQSGVHVELFKPWLFSIFGSYLNRMHDKLLVIDDNTLFIGDRNAGAEYYDYHQDLANPNSKAFISRDVVIKGQIAKQAASYIRQLIVHKITEAQRFHKVSDYDLSKGKDVLNRAYGQIPTRFLREADEWKSRLTEAQIEFFYDKPGRKGDGPGTYEAVLAALNFARSSIVIENPYIVFTHEMRYALQHAAERGVKITVLTNSVSSTDSLLVAGGWVESREFLAQIGATVYEIKGHVLSKSERFKKLFRVASSKASLHSKTMVIDDRYAYVMSFNMDPRSSFKNTEVAVKIASEALAKHLQDDIHESIHLHSKQVVSDNVVHPHAQDCGTIVRFLSKVLHDQL